MAAVLMYCWDALNTQFETIRVTLTAKKAKSWARVHPITVLALSCALSAAAAGQRLPLHAQAYGQRGRLVAQMQRPKPNGPPADSQSQGTATAPPPLTFHPRGPGPHRGDWLRKYGNLPPDQLQQKLQQDPQFQHLPPQRQQALRERLDHFNSLPPEKKQRVLNRMELIEHLPPERQQQVEGLFQQFRSLNPDRRQAVVQQLRYLRNLPPDQRQKALDSGQFKTGFNGQEQQIIRGMTDLSSEVDRQSAHGPGL